MPQDTGKQSEVPIMALLGAWQLATEHARKLNNFLQQPFSPLMPLL